MDLLLCGLDNSSEIFDRKDSIYILALQDLALPDPASERKNLASDSHPLLFSPETTMQIELVRAEPEMPYSKSERKAQGFP